MTEKINIAVIGYPIQQASNFISFIQNNQSVNLIRKTVGREKTSFKIGSGNEEYIQVYEYEEVDIFKNIDKLIVVDFSYEINHVDFYRINNIRHIVPGEDLLPEEILEVILSENK